jgi:hypothetical protein
MDKLLPKREIATVWVIDTTPEQLREVANQLEQGAKIEIAQPGQDVLAQLTSRISVRYAVPSGRMEAVSFERTAERTLQ